MTLPEGSSTSATPVTPGEDGSGQSGLQSRSCKYSGVRRSAVYRWKPGLWIAAASYSGPGHRRMSGDALAPVSACRSRSDYEYCSGGISLPQSDCVVQLLLLHYQLDGYPYDLMIEYAGDWCFA